VAADDARGRPSRAQRHGDEAGEWPILVGDLVKGSVCRCLEMPLISGAVDANFGSKRHFELIMTGLHGNIRLIAPKFPVNHCKLVPER
jgi:hypothetical protein